MKKTMIVLKNEIITLLSRPSFWLTTFGIPVIAWLIFSLVGRINQNSSTSSAISGIFNGPAEMRPEGYVDLAGLIKNIPPSFPPGALLSFEDEEAARAAMGQDKISAFYIIPADYLEKGQLFYMREDFNPLASSGGQSTMFQWVLQVNLLGGDSMLASIVNGPLEVQEVALAPTTQASLDDDNPMAFMLPYGITLLFYFLIMGSSSLLLSNVSKEKENRVMETLLTSLTPTQLLTGKIIGLGLVGLLQTVLWLGTAYALVNLSGQVFSLPFKLPGLLLTWGIIFFILGYAVYASLMAGLGALAPNMREATQVTVVIMLPLIIPLFFSSSVFVTEPNGPIATVLSIFPLSAPVAMMARLVSGGVPAWQLVLTAFLLVVTAVLIVRAVAGMFRAQALLSGQPIKVKTYLQTLLGRS